MLITAHQSNPQTPVRVTRTFSMCMSNFEDTDTDGVWLKRFFFWHLKLELKQGRYIYFANFIHRLIPLCEAHWTAMSYTLICDRYVSSDNRGRYWLRFETKLTDRTDFSSSRRQPAAFNSLVASGFVAWTLKEIFADDTTQPRAIAFEANPDCTSWGILALVSPSRPHPFLTAVFAKSLTIQSAGGKFESARPNNTHSALLCD